MERVLGAQEEARRQVLAWRRTRNCESMLWGPLFTKKCRAPLMADTTAAATAASSAPAASSLVAQTGAGSPWGTVRLRPARWLPSRRPLCHLLVSRAV